MAPPDTLLVSIEGMTCGGCVRAARTALERVPGVTVEALTLDAPAVVHLDRALAAPDDVTRAIEAAGYTATIEAS